MPPASSPNQSGGRMHGIDRIGARADLEQYHMPSASGTFCQKIQRQDRCWMYQSSSEAEILSDTSRFRAYNAMP